MVDGFNLIHAGLAATRAELNDRISRVDARAEQRSRDQAKLIREVAAQLGSRIGDQDDRIREVAAQLGVRIGDQTAQLSGRIGDQDKLIREVAAQLGSRIDDQEKLIREVAAQLSGRIDDQEKMIREVAAQLGSRSGDQDKTIREVAAQLGVRIGERDKLIREMRDQLTTYLERSSGTRRVVFGVLGGAALVAGGALARPLFEQIVKRAVRRLTGAGAAAAPQVPVVLPPPRRRSRRAPAGSGQPEFAPHPLQHSGCEERLGLLLDQFPEPGGGCAGSRASSPPGPRSRRAGCRRWRRRPAGSQPGSRWAAASRAS